MSMEKILVAEEDPLLLEALKKERLEMVRLNHVEQLKQEQFDLLVCSSLDLLKQAKAEQPSLSVIMVSRLHDIRRAVEAMRLGACDYVVYPFSHDTWGAALDKAAQERERHHRSREASLFRGGKIEQILTESSIMKQIVHDVGKIAKSDSSVFISGESGTGKEVIAHAIHFQSQRAQKPFIKVNCAAIAESLMESEFFGHEKGAFTGAMARRLGRFELADSGTLLLDEISEIPLPLQSKLLRVVQEREFERVGGVHPVHVDVRLISTSNRSMKEMVEKKLFREDLYYRLNVVPLHLPPLRERREDILSLAEYFLERLCMENHKKRKRLSQVARKKLLEYHFPGNIRELANIIERTVVMDCSDLIEEQHLCLDPATCRNPFADQTLYEMEKKHILETLASHNHNRTRAAEVLGINVRTLRSKLKQFQLPD